MDTGSVIEHSHNWPRAFLRRPMVPWGTPGGNPSQNGTAIEQEWFPELDRCLTGGGCIGHREAIYKALNDLKTRLGDPTIAALAQSNIFDKLGTDTNGNALTTQSFIRYLDSKPPRFYDGTRSTYCYEVLLGQVPQFTCFKLNIIVTTVKYQFGFQMQASAFADTPSYPLLTFLRPTAIGFNNLGKNIGNEGIIFHEALHGISGKDDGFILQRLGFDSLEKSCKISETVRNTVLSHSLGLDSEIAWPCN